ncbi:MAG: hypothetical protein ACT4OJ_04235 [Bacteroidota bacterium]
MKSLFVILVMSFILTFFSNSGCKKKTDNPNCGCNSNEIKYSLQNIDGFLSYRQYNNKWMLTYYPAPGAVSNYFPCNTNQDSLRAILQGVNQSQVFQVKFSGKVKGPCPGEDFGFTSGVTTNDYINIDSLKRN